MTVFLSCLAVLLGLGLAERLARDAAWRAVPIRVHVNGTRGKSTVTRLIWSALREAGVPAMAKTTGTAPRLLFPDGAEREIRRRAPASIREQLALLRLARRQGARAVVVECMAIDPGLQFVAERDMIRATVGVITNVRLDHTEVMGWTHEAIACSLANTVPAGSVLVTAAGGHEAAIERRARAAGTRVVTVPPRPGDEGGGERWLREDEDLALAVTREIGIPDAVAREGFARAPRDPGAARSGVAAARGGPLRWIDATAANDPESLSAIASREGAAAAPQGDLVVYNHRADRAARLACFADHSRVLALSARLAVTGDRPPWTVWRRLRALRSGRPTVFVPPGELQAWLREHAAGSRLVFCGNTRGIDAAAVVEGASRG